MKTAPEDVYEEWRRCCVAIKSGSYPKATKNFDNAKAKPNWIYFVRFSEMCNRTNMLDYRKYIKCLADFHKGWFQPQELMKQHSIKLYKGFIASEMLRESEQASIIRSFKFVTQYIKDHEIASLKDYFNVGLSAVPLFVRHYQANYITKEFLRRIDYVGILIAKLPQDVKTLVGDVCE
jgi:hypothetical protein